jgi:hypothetical protein
MGRLAPELTGCGGDDAGEIDAIVARHADALEFMSSASSGYTTSICRAGSARRVWAPLRGIKATVPVPAGETRKSAQTLEPKPKEVRGALISRGIRSVEV